MPHQLDLREEGGLMAWNPTDKQTNTVSYSMILLI